MAESFESARNLILAKVSQLPAESISLLDAGGRVLNADIHAPYDLPRWDNSAMDGFAVRTQDCGFDHPLRVDANIPAGISAEGIQVKSGTAVRIMTGAPVPAGCDTVVPVEETEESDAHVVIKGPIQIGDHIRKRGEDVKQGELVLAAGSILQPAGINLLAAFGFNQVTVIRRPRVAILSTGDELVEPGEALGPGQIYNSNAYSLAASIREVGAEPLLLGIARDEHDSLTQKLCAGLEADVLISTAGVSMGDRDLVCEVLEELQVERLFWKIDIKPGRPTAFSIKDGTLVFSLPGNPVSSMVTFEEFVRPALLKMMGHQSVIKPYVKAKLREAYSKKTGRTQFLRVRVVDSGEGLIASSAGDQNTGILSTMLRANGIAVLPAADTTFAAGAEVCVHLLANSGLEH